MINDFFVPELDDVSADDLWFQQEGSTYHIANQTINLLNDIFGERIIFYTDGIFFCYPIF